MRIKEKPEDFIVKEVMNLEIGKGNYSYFRLVKEKWNTMDLISRIAKILKIKEKDIGFAGNKDKQAITWQHISIFNINPERVTNLKIKDVELSYLGNGKNRINLGELEGNEFIILIKESKELKKKKFVNYFGEQRFGIKGNNSKIGKHLVKNEFKEACELLELKTERNDYVGALRTFGRRKLKLFVAAYQSELWNRLVKELKKENRKIPIVGYLDDSNLYDEMLAEEGVDIMDFIIRPLKEIGAEGGERNLLIDVKDFKMVKEGKDTKVSFFLPKGCYATEVIRQLAL